MSLFGRDRAPRRGTPFEWLIVGLGNPGKEYAHSRHNVGVDCIETIARRLGETLRAGRDKALVAETTIADQRCVLAFPTTYMNLSGESVGALVRRYAVGEPSRIVIVHDELDLPPGTVRVKVGGGLAGHNGLRSITQHLKTQDYVRVRIGVGKPASKEQGANHVLSRIPKAEREVLDIAIERAADAVEAIMASGPDAAMAAFNGT